MEIDPRWIGAFIPVDHWHFHSQLLKRFAIVLAPGEFSAIRKRFVNDSALLIEERRHRRAIYSVRVKSVDQRIYVLAERGRIITAWPPERRLNAIRRRLTTPTHPRAGWADAAQSVAAAGDDAPAWPESGNNGDSELQW